MLTAVDLFLVCHSLSAWNQHKKRKENIFLKSFQNTLLEPRWQALANTIPSSRWVSYDDQYFEKSFSNSFKEKRLSNFQGCQFLPIFQRHFKCVFVLDWTQILVYMKKVIPRSHFRSWKIFSKMWQASEFLVNGYKIKDFTQLSQDNKYQASNWI